MKEVIVLTEQDVANAISMQNKMQEAWDAAHQAIDKLIIMGVQLNRDGPLINMDLIRTLQEETFKLVHSARDKCHDILKFLDYQKGE